MEGAVSWVKSIAYYVIIISLFQGILPDNRYKKYVQLFTGMVLILLILSPLFRLQSQEQTLSDAFTGYVTDVLQMEVTEETGQLWIQTYYETELKQLMESCGYDVYGIRITLNENNTPELVTMSVRQKTALQEDDSLVQGVETVQVGRNGEENATQEQILHGLEQLIQEQYDLTEGKVKIQNLP